MNTNKETHELPELTFKAILLAVILAVILAAANAYIGLKVGLIVSASIPAAVVAMVVFRFSKQSNILENNIVQTGASASACVAAGVVFVIPALLITQYWHDINYWQTVFVCLSGGILGILLSIPLRRALLAHPQLRFPEGRAIAEILKANNAGASIRELILGSAVGSLMQFGQQGLQIFASGYQWWIATNQTIYGFALGFDASMLGAGYIIGFRVSMSILLGIVVTWLIGVPTLFMFIGLPNAMTDPTSAVTELWSNQIRYLGIGGLLLGGIWSLFHSIRPILASVKLSLQSLSLTKKPTPPILPRVDQDIPLPYILGGILVLLLAIVVFMLQEFAILTLGLSTLSSTLFLIFTLFYILVAGFIFATVCAYFSGLVGVSASPISSMNIAALILFALSFSFLLQVEAIGTVEKAIIMHAIGISILITAIIACADTVANGNIQDLKTGAIIGATPWKLEVMLIIGVIVSTLVVPPIVTLLYNVYGIGNIMPHAGMDPHQVLAAPQASLLAVIAKGVFFRQLPLQMILIGMGIMLGVIIANLLLRRFDKEISALGFGFGMYLPMTVTIPLILGGLLAGLLEMRLAKSTLSTPDQLEAKQRVTLIACGLVAGASIVGILLAIPFAIAGNANIFSLVTPTFTPIAVLLALLVTLVICIWMYTTGVRKN